MAYRKRKAPACVHELSLCTARDIGYHLAVTWRRNLVIYKSNDKVSTSRQSWKTTHLYLWCRENGSQGYGKDDKRRTRAKGWDQNWTTARTGNVPIVK